MTIPYLSRSAFDGRALGSLTSEQVRGISLPLLDQRGSLMVIFFLSISGLISIGWIGVLLLAVLMTGGGVTSNLVALTPAFIGLVCIPPAILWTIVCACSRVSPIAGLVVITLFAGSLGAVGYNAQARAEEARSTAADEQSVTHDRASGRTTIGGVTWAELRQPRTSGMTVHYWMAERRVHLVVWNKEWEIPFGTTIQVPLRVGANTFTVTLRNSSVEEAARDNEQRRNVNRIAERQSDDTLTTRGTNLLGDEAVRFLDSLSEHGGVTFIFPGSSGEVTHTVSSRAQAFIRDEIKGQRPVAANNRQPHTH